MNKKMACSVARRNTLRKLAASGVLGTGGIIGLLQAALAANTQTGMRSIEGEVTIDGKPATIGQQVRPGQKVATGADAEAIFVIGKDAFLQRENSEFAWRAGAVPVLRYLSGKVLSVFGKGRKRLDTPTATVGIRGTACYIEAEQEQTYFCLCYGTALVTPKGMPTMHETVRTQHHEHPMYIRGGNAREIMESARVINHTDAELIMLEGLVGRLPPFFGKDYPLY